MNDAGPFLSVVVAGFDVVCVVTAPIGCGPRSEGAAVAAQVMCSLSGWCVCGEFLSS